jgi:hypothetical protein
MSRAGSAGLTGTHELLGGRAGIAYNYIPPESPNLPETACRPERANP